MSVNQVNSKLDAEHFRVLHNQYRHRLLDSMTGLVKDRVAAEEITATAFAKAFEKRSSFRGDSSPYTWRYAIGLNEARSNWGQNRSVSLESLTGPEPEALVECGIVADNGEPSQNRLKLERALHQIPAICRRTLVEHFVRGYSVKRISRQDRIPLGTVLSRIFTAKRLLRQGWDWCRAMISALAWSMSSVTAPFLSGTASAPELRPSDRVLLLFPDSSPEASSGPRS